MGLCPNASPRDLAATVHRVRKQRYSLRRIGGTKVSLACDLIPLVSVRDGDSRIGDVGSLLNFLTFILVFATTVGCILVIVSALVGQAGRITIRGYCKTSSGGLFNVVVSRAYLRVLVSLLLTTFLVILFHAGARRLLKTALKTLFSARAVIVLVKIYVIVFFVANLVPACVFLHVPITTTFHGFGRSHEC